MTPPLSFQQINYNLSGKTINCVGHSERSEESPSKATYQPTEILRRKLLRMTLNSILHDKLRFIILSIS
jgi:hypothetical protein